MEKIENHWIRDAVDSAEQIEGDKNKYNKPWLGTKNVGELVTRRCDKDIKESLGQNKGVDVDNRFIQQNKDVY